MQRTVLGALLILAAMLIGLALMGRRWWCACGHLAPWAGEIHTSHNSQHLLDPYSFTHVLHGVLLYCALWLLMRRSSVSTRFLVALGLEAVWEIVENSPFVIERFRQSAISLNYVGDSIANSVGDLICCAAGLGIAAWLPVWGSVALVLATEIVLYLWVRDNLSLVIWALFFPEKPSSP